MIHDYRKVNESTVNTSYPMPLMGDVLDDILRNKSQYFGVVDLKTAFITAHET